MSKPTVKNSINRIIDANINRAKEGLRVCEEITRFLLEDKSLTSELKQLRHKISLTQEKIGTRQAIVAHRESRQDIGKNIYARELKRKGLSDIFYANIQRSKESLRVLEEFTKLLDPKIALAFKEIRYSSYEIEKKAIKKIAALRDYR